MFFARSLFSVMVLASSCAVVACIDMPRLSSNAGEDLSGTGSVVTERAGMTLVPAVTFDGAVAPMGVDPNGKGKGKDKDDKGKNDAGAPPVDAPPAQPPPAGSDPAPTDPAGGAPAAGGAKPLAVAAFWIDVREVTAAAYRDCLDASACTAPPAGAGCTLSADALSSPVTCVTIEQARAFCTWANKRLVQDLEWTAAAAGNTRRPYPWGTEPPAADRLNACGSECGAAGMYAVSDGHVGVAPGGSFPLGRTPDGVDDLGGNVAEWTDSALASTVRGASYADTDAAFAGSTSTRVAAEAGPTVGFRCAANR